MKKVIKDGREYYLIGYNTMGKWMLSDVKDGTLDAMWPPKEYTEIFYCDPATGKRKSIKREDHGWLE